MGAKAVRKMLMKLTTEQGKKCDALFDRPTILNKQTDRIKTKQDEQQQ